jgi:hypothetical protein
MLLIQVGVLTFMAYLLALHLVLRERGISTFELITYRRQLKADADARKLSKCGNKAPRG